MNESISSSANPTIRALRKLASSAKQRQKERRFIADGIHLVQSYLKASGTPELYAVADSSLVNPEVAELVKILDSTNIKRVQVKDSLYETFSDSHASGGISIVCSIPKHTAPTTCSADALLLDDVQDPGNLGTILRTAAATGIQSVYTSTSSASAWSPKALRAGMGAQFSLQIYEGVDLVEMAQKTTIATYATVLSSGSTNLYDLELTGPAMWIFGSEGQGISSELAAAARQHVTIPQVDSSVESLNVAAAAIVCLYEQYRQRLNK